MLEKLAWDVNLKVMLLEDGIYFIVVFGEIKVLQDVEFVQFVNMVKLFVVCGGRCVRVLCFYVFVDGYSVLGDFLCWF